MLLFSERPREGAKGCSAAIFCLEDCAWFEAGLVHEHTHTHTHVKAYPHTPQCACDIDQIVSVITSEICVSKTEDIQASQDTLSSPLILCSSLPSLHHPPSISLSLSHYQTLPSLCDQYLSMDQLRGRKQKKEKNRAPLHWQAWWRR